MLKSLTIQNLATIETLQAEFSEGLNVLTGETGAGKSVLIGGLELALGGRGGGEGIRGGCSLAVVEAVFEPQGPSALIHQLICKEMELEWAFGEPLVLRRELTRSGRNRCLINSQLVGVSDLKRLGELLVDFHGQHEHQSLFQSAAARQALDAFAGTESLVETVNHQWNLLRALTRRHEELEREAIDYERRLDFLHYQIQEIENLAPVIGELETLEQEEKRLASAEELSRAAIESHTLLYEGNDQYPAVLGLMREIRRRVSGIAGMDTGFIPILERLEEQRSLLEDLAYELRDYGETMQSDPQKLDQVATRRDTLKKLVRKHGGTEQSTLESLSAMRLERDQMVHNDAERTSITESIQEAKDQLIQSCQQLSALRHAAATRFGEAVLATLAELGMEKARFEVHLETLIEPAPEGLDRVEFMLAANPGLPPAPLRRIASGGEISRVMLALKSVLASRDSIPTLVFDEIDTGLSGDTARKVGRLMHKLGESHQILCITHHASIAACAGWHGSIMKRLEGEATYTELRTLDADNRLDELARMMGIIDGGMRARELARQLALSETEAH